MFSLSIKTTLGNFKYWFLIKDLFHVRIFELDLSFIILSTIILKAQKSLSLRQINIFNFMNFFHI